MKKVIQMFPDRDLLIVRKGFTCSYDVSFVSKITGHLQEGQVVIHLRHDKLITESGEKYLIGR